MKHNKLPMHRVRILVVIFALLPAIRYNHADVPAGTANDYVVLTDLEEDDPYFAAAHRLREYRQAQLIHFPPGKVMEALEQLRQTKPSFVAVVVAPETLDVNFAYDVLELAASVDDDPFTDFMYGYITGATPGDALELIERTIRAEAEQLPDSGHILAFGPTSTPQMDIGSNFEWLPHWESIRIEHEPGRFPQSNLADIANADLIRFWGHGTPQGVIGSLTQSDIAKLDLRARAVFAGPCFSAVTRRYYQPDACSKLLAARCINPNHSLALTFLAKGAITYVGALQEDRCLSAGQEMEYAITSGKPVGMALKHTHDRITMGRASNTMRFFPFQAGRPIPHISGTAAQLRWAASRILLGDPAFRPFAPSSAQPVETTVKIKEDEIAIVANIVEPRIRNLFVTPFRNNLCECGTDNDTLYMRVKIPSDTGKIRGVRHIVLPPCLKTVRHSPAIWKEETQGNERLLHIQIDFQHDTLRTVTGSVTVIFAIDHSFMFLH